MDDRTRAKVVEALRTAARALRLAEQSLLAPAEPHVAAPAAPVPGAQPVAPPNEQALLDFILAAAEVRKNMEETDPASFQAKLMVMPVKPLRLAVDRQMYTVKPGASGAVGFETMPVVTSYEKLLKMMIEVGIDTTAFLTSFTDQPHLKNISDVDPNVDLVLVRYETPEPVSFTLPEEKLALLVEQAKTTPGAVDRVAVALKDNAVRWTPFVDNKLNPIAIVDDVDAKWTASVSINEIGAALSKQVVLVEAVREASPVWWSAMQGSTTQVPAAILEVVRGRKQRTFVKVEEANKIEDWASSLDGWFSEPTPLLIRDISIDDILV